LQALGIRHGVDPDHLTAIDGLARFHPSRWNGVLFALGHGVLVTVLALGFGTLLAGVIAPHTAWILLSLGVVNLWRLCHPAHHQHSRAPRLFRASPLLLGVIFGMGFETASQLSALLLAGRLNPWTLGTVFSAGMILVDGTDGYLAARTQQLALSGRVRAIRSSRILSALVIIFSFGVATAEFGGLDLNRIALPLGLSLFVAIIVLRLWSAGSHTMRSSGMTVTGK
jgi:nickel/cobalt transporter (NiCoT) family protein